MGTPDFAVGALEALVKSGYAIVAVVTQPDKEKGRGGKVQCSPVKEFALTHQLPVFQPVKIREKEAVDQLRAYKADIFIVAAFGQILTKEILTMPQYGCVNIHASLLPKYRGAAPIQQAILDGEKETGITIMQMDEGIDTGDILLQQSVSIENTDTGESLFEKMTVCGANLIIKALPLIQEGKITPVKQDDSKSSYAKMLKKEMGLLNFNESSEVLDCKVRGLNSWPSAYTYYQGKTLKIWKAFPCEEKKEWSHTAPGVIVEVVKDAFTVKSANGGLKITEVQLEGKKRMATSAFLLGYQVEVGQKLEMTR